MAERKEAVRDTRGERGGVFPEKKGTKNGRRGGERIVLWTGRSGYCRYNEAKARFLPFHSHASSEIMSRMTDCVRFLWQLGLSYSASPPSYVVMGKREEKDLEKTRDFGSDQYHT